MPSAIFRRLEKPAEDYLSNVKQAIVEVVDSTDSSLTGMNSGSGSGSDRTSLTVEVEQEERRLPPPGEVPYLMSEEDKCKDPVIAINLKRGETEHQQHHHHQLTMPLPQVAKKHDGVTFSSGTILNASSNPVTPDTSMDAHDEEKRGSSGSAPNPAQDEELEPSSSKSRPTTEKELVKHGRRHGYQVRNRNRRTSTEDDYSSSDDDSSYFATHLPSPKSGRSFSISSNASNASAPGRTSMFQIQKQGSDASLSFSDESDDEHHHHHHHHPETNVQIIQSVAATESGVHLSPVVHPNRSVVNMNLYPQRITRMHSVSSLVSSASSDNNNNNNNHERMDEDSDSGEGEEPNRRRTFTGDSMSSSLPSVSSTGPEGIHRNNTDAAAGEGAYYVQGTNLSHHPQYIHQSPGMVPMYLSQQQPMTSQQMMAWATTPPSDSEFDYVYSNSNRSGSGIQSEQSSASLAMVYSEDDEVAVTRFVGSKNALSSASATGKQASNAGASGGRATNGNGLTGGGGGSGSGGPRGNPGSSGPSGRDLGRGSQNAPGDAESKAVSAANGGSPGNGAMSPAPSGRPTFKVYWQRWLMLFYMSVLNLLSDWTCYSVAPISLLTEEAFGNIDPERLVVVFLGANAIATACEPMLLARLGLRRTVLMGSLLLMIGSIIKSGGLFPIMEPSLEKGHAESSLYLGFFIVGLSQPLYQCTPALLSASWFPEEERTMATGVALNANQLGIGFAFIFGTLLVSEADDIPSYFGLLSQISTLCFIGTLIQFDDAPPTPPSSSARVMKGNLNFKMPQFANRQLQRYFSSNLSEKKPEAQAPSPAASNVPLKDEKEKHKRSSKTKKSGRSSSARRRTPAPKFQTANAENGLSAPSNAHFGSTREAMEDLARTNAEFEALVPHAHAPSPAPMSGRPTDSGGGDLGSPNREETNPESASELHAHSNPPGQMPMGPPEGQPGTFPPGQMHMPGAYPPYGYPPGGYQYYPYYTQEQIQQHQLYLQQMFYQQQMAAPPLSVPGMPPQMGGAPGMPPQMGGAPGMPPQMGYLPPPHMAMPMYSYQQQFPPPLGEFDPRSDAYDIDAYGDRGAEPRVTVTNHHLDIDIRDDQVVRSLHACMIRQGFSHALAAFTVSGIVINTLSTYMDYLVRLNGAPRSYTGIVGGTFQFAIMASSLIMGKQTDKTRAYYSVTTGMLVLGAFGLAECGVSLDSNRGSDLRWSLLLVAVLVGPLQPISTELGVEVAYPLSENTVLVIQQLFSNLLSAIFIPFFKSLKDIGTTAMEDGEIVQRPEYTFSFYLLIVLHTLVTVYFATFNGKYLRYEHELQKKEEEDAEYGEREEEEFFPNPVPSQQYTNQGGEHQPLISRNQPTMAV